MAITRIYFPFLTYEVKYSATALDITDRQNTYNIIIAVRALVKLFRSVKREKELDREIFAFSVSYDYRSVRIYGYYFIIEGDKTIFYCYPIYEFSFTVLDSKKK